MLMSIIFIVLMGIFFAYCIEDHQSMKSRRKIYWLDIQFDTEYVHESLKEKYGWWAEFTLTEVKAHGNGNWNRSGSWSYRRIGQRSS